MRPKNSIIAAITPEKVIGKKGGGLLWHIPGDMRRFKELTTGHVVVMGRKTYETIGKPLPNRTNIIITKNKNYSAPDCLVVPSLEEALEKAKEIENNEIFIMGGGEIYKEAMPYADKLYLTLVHQSFEGDVFFPNYAEFKKEVFREEGESVNGLKYTFLELEKSP